MRQAVAGTELVDRGGAPWTFLKEISSNGNMSTVDVIYPAFPAYLYLSPSYLRLLLEPVLDCAEHGILLDPRNDYTKGDWEIWTAAWLSRYPARNGLINGVYNFANETASRVPFTDWYVVASAAQRGFAARPVMGGMPALLPTAAPSGAQWARIQNRTAAKCSR